MGRVEKERCKTCMCICSFLGGGLKQVQDCRGCTKGRCSGGCFGGSRGASKGSKGRCVYIYFLLRGAGCASSCRTAAAVRGGGVQVGGVCFSVCVCVGMGEGVFCVKRQGRSRCLCVSGTGEGVRRRKAGQKGREAEVQAVCECVC